MHIRGPQEEGVARPATSGQRQSTITPRPTAEVAAPGKPPPDRSLPPRLRTADRQQLLSPLLIDDLIEADHPARAVWHFAEGLDLSVLYDRIRARGPVAGRPAIDPRLLVALWLYATLAGVKSANALATLCIHHDAYFWLAGGLAVNAHTLSDFRVQDADVLERMLEHSVTVLRQQGLIDLDRVAQDGMRVRASAGAASFRRRETLARLLHARGAGRGAAVATASRRTARPGAARTVATTAGGPVAARARACRANPTCPAAHARDGGEEGEEGEGNEEEVQAKKGRPAGSEE